MVVHLISDDIYIDIKITSWEAGSNSGGGFSYERSTNPNLSAGFLKNTDIFFIPTLRQGSFT